MSFLLSDQYKCLKILTLILVLTSLIVYGFKQAPSRIPNYSAFHQNPTLYLQTDIPFGGRITQFSSGTFSVEQVLDGQKENILIYGHLERARINDRISGVAINNNSRLELKNYHLSNLHTLKVGVSFLAFVGVVLIFIKDYLKFFKHA